MDTHVQVATAQLGGWIADFPRSTRARGARWLLIGLLVGLGLLLIALGWQARPQVAPIVLGVGALLLPMAAVVAYISFRNGTSQPQLTLYEQGVVVPRGGQMHPIRYEDIEMLWEQILWYRGRSRVALPKRTHVYTLRTRDRRTLRLSDQFADVRQAGAVIQQEMLRRSLPVAVAAYRGGEALSFGPLTISRSGLARGKKALPWAEVAHVSVTEGPYRGTAASTYNLQVTRIGQRRPWLKIDLAQIPNNRLLLALLKESGVALDLAALSSPE